MREIRTSGLKRGAPVRLLRNARGPARDRSMRKSMRIFGSSEARTDCQVLMNPVSVPFSRPIRVVDGVSSAWSS